MFKREPTKGNLDAYRITRAKARRDIRHSKKTSWRIYSSDNAEVYKRPFSIKELQDALRRAHDTSAGSDEIH